MLKRDMSDSIIIFGTTQIDPIYAAKLANVFPNQRKILVDGFCERALPCSEYSKNVPFDAIWHLDTKGGQQSMKNILRQEKKSPRYILFGSIYLVGYIM
ncbi:MAG: hypothetical protein WCK88_03620 [bacterium]